MRGEINEWRNYETKVDFVSNFASYKIARQIQTFQIFHQNFKDTYSTIYNLDSIRNFNLQKIITIFSGDLFYLK